ncbi:MAG: GPW/gp25 family protein [Flavobacteriales bacterium]|nr:GPW/gp25 family protein [Flavobacteriales bacterium]
MPGYSPKYPLTVNSVDGYYTMNKTVFDAIRQNFKNLLLTNPGERIMIPEYGVGISKYLFENLESGFDVSLTTEIEYQLGKYLPQVSLVDVTVLTSEDRNDISINGVYIKITYFISSFGVTDNITIGPESLTFD